MSSDLISGKTITELYKYLQNNGSSYNDLRGYFRNSKIEPREDVIYTSTRNKDKFLDQYIRPLRLNDTGDINRLIVFIEQILTVFNNPNTAPLLESLSQDGWQLLGSKLTRIGHSVEDMMTSMIEGDPIDTIQREWDRAKKSMVNDPADALTAASSMIEATYKYIIHQRQISLPSNQDIRGLAKTVHQALVQLSGNAYRDMVRSPTRLLVPLRRR